MCIVQARVLPKSAKMLLVIRVFLLLYSLRPIAIFDRNRRLLSKPSHGRCHQPNYQEIFANITSTGSLQNKARARCVFHYKSTQEAHRRL